MNDMETQPARQRVEILRAGIEMSPAVAAENGVQGVQGAWRPAVGQTITLNADHARALILNGGANYILGDLADA
jgi:hypothetical protein